MKEESAEIRFLIGIAFLLGACILVYNLFYIPDAISFSNIQTDVSLSSLQPEDGEVPQSSSGVFQKYDVNTVSAQELENIPGIGPVTAQAIVQYREEQGPFISLEELMQIPGIGEKTYLMLSEWLYIGEDASSESQ